MATTYIPGAGTLGYGFDVMGTYSDAAKTRPLFKMAYDSQQTWSDYLVPSNTSVDPQRKVAGYSTYVDSRRKMEEFFSAKASVKASYGLFSAQFDASYSMTNKSDVEYQFGMVQSYQTLYRLELVDRSPAALADWVLNDPAYQNIPAHFTDADRELFFRFFDKYGLYYVRAVDAGSRMFYSSSVAKSYKYSSQEAEAKLKLEYGALFTASGEASWKQVGEDWASQREVKVEAVGGSSAMLNILMPGYGANHSAAYEAWLKSAEADPATIAFALAPIAEIVPEEKAAAVERAVDAYLRHKLILESKTGTCLINLNGESILPPPVGDTRTLGYQLAAIKRRGMGVSFARSYTTGDYWSKYELLYESMLKDIQKYNSSDYIIVFTTFSNFAQNAPPKPFCEFLAGCGAGAKLDLWLDTKNSNSKIDRCCALAHCNYVFVGIPGGEVGAYESFERAGSCDTGSWGWWYGSSWLDKPAPMAGLIVDLYEFLVDSELVGQLGRAR
ncbi:MAG TPA: MAC/perforin domain-containing protein [Solirubrobacteraceae bacterium]|nr:MAC/perforin domain-containing protein [Solirubrobacteraceae bacterium]